MIHNAKVGERVKIVKPRPSLALKTPWLLAGCTTGTIEHRTLFYGQSPSLWVRPDADGPAVRFRPEELERIP